MPKNNKEKQNGHTIVVTSRFRSHIERKLFCVSGQGRRSDGKQQRCLSRRGEVAFTVKLDAPLPNGARFQVRISPVDKDQQIVLESGDPIDSTNTTFKVKSHLPDTVIPGKWHISVIYLFLPGTSWTNNTIQPNDLTFEVAGKPLTVPTKAEVSIAH